MDDRRVGLALRALRSRRGLRQAEFGAAVGLSQQAVSLVERGHGATLSIRTLRRMFAFVDARCELEVRWRGGELDRLVDERHAALVAAVVDRLGGLGWEVRPEVSYAVFGERGAIDVLAARPIERAALVVEVKSQLASLEATLRKLDEKIRLARQGIVAETFGWRPRVVGAMLVLPEGTSARRRLGAHRAVIEAALPADGRAVLAWLRAPSGDLRGVMLVAGSRRPPRSPGTSPRGRRRQDATESPGSSVNLGAIRARS